MTIVNDDSRVINKLEASLTDRARVIIYDCHMFIVQATSGLVILLTNIRLPKKLARDKHSILFCFVRDEGLKFL
jgi:hypothetical protein